MSLKIKLSLSVLTSSLILLFLSGCGSDEPEYVEVEQIEEEAPVAMDPHAGHNHPPGEHPEMPADHLGFDYTVPEGWSVTAPSSMVLFAMEAGSALESPANCAVSAFPGDVGGQLANVNRWRRQVGLGPISPEALEGFVTNLQVSGIDAWQVDMTGPAGSGTNGGAARVVVTALPHEGRTWFFKLTGNDTSIEDELDAYGGFLESIKF